MWCVRAALSDKISFIEDGVAQEVKRQVDIEAAAMTIQYHSIYVAACAVHPEQVQHAERTGTSPQSSDSTTDNSDGESLDPQDNAIPTTSTQFKHLKGSAQCMTSAQWID